VSLDQQYNPRLSDDSVEKYFEVWRRDSLASKLKIPRFDLDLAFGSSPGQRLDVFYTSRNPVESRLSPTLIFIHGGYWRALDKSDFSFVARAFTENGINVVLTNYDLCPAVDLREICLQQANALAWLYRNSQTLGLNKHKIIVSGHSAGGHLSALMLAADWKVYGNDLPSNLVKAAITLSGLFDLRPIALAPFLAADLRLNQTDAIALSPAFMPPATRAPLLTAVGEHESKSFHDQTTAIEMAWRRNFQRRMPALGANHFSICGRFATIGDPLFETSLRLLKSI
jgi:arylformamidase